MKILISFANQKFYKSQKILEDTACRIGKVDKVISYHWDDLKNEFFWRENIAILTRLRGAGYWIWKPYIILKNLSECTDQDVVMYSDAGINPIANLSPLFDIAYKKGKMLFRVPDGHMIRTWTKRDCYILTGCDEGRYYNQVMINANIHLWRKNEENISFLNEWQNYLKDSRIVTDDANVCGKPNIIGFREHRHDQSVLSLLCVKYGFEVHRDSTQFGLSEINQFHNSPYPQLMYGHGEVK